MASVKIEINGRFRLPRSVKEANKLPEEEAARLFVYRKVFERDPFRVQSLKEKIASGAKSCRKIHRIRDMELGKLGFEAFAKIQRDVEATIMLFADHESHKHSLSYLDLIGTTEEVEAAEEAIIARVLEEYDEGKNPVVLMPLAIYKDRVFIPNGMVALVDEQELGMEIEYNAWSKIELGPEETVVKLFGLHDDVKKLKAAINLMVHEYQEFMAKLSTPPTVMDVIALKIKENQDGDGGDGDGNVGPWDAKPEDLTVEQLRERKRMLIDMRRRPVEHEGQTDPFAKFKERLLFGFNKKKVKDPEKGE